MVRVRDFHLNHPYKVSDLGKRGYRPAHMLPYIVEFTSASR
jgi:hypothetical protein